MKSTYIKINNPKLHRDSLMAVVFQSGFIYDKGNRNYTTVKDLNADVGFYWDNLQVGNHKDETTLNFCGGTPDFYWPEDADKVIDFLTGKSITVENVGEYTATVTIKGIQVGCQTISLQKFDELAKAVAEVRS